MKRRTRSHWQHSLVRRVLSRFAGLALWRRPHRHRSTAIGVELLSRTRNLHVVSSERLLFYQQGMTARFAQIAGEYGVPEYVSIGPGDMVIDVGANIGEFALICSEAGATVYALEPDISAFLCLAKNVGGHSITPFHVAAWSEDSLERLHIASESADSSLINPATESQQVLALRLDTFAAVCGIERVRLLKCDVEGAEPEVLRGAASLLVNTEYVSFDCGRERGGESTLAACEQILSEAGFDIVRREESGRYNLVARNRRIQNDE